MSTTSFDTTQGTATSLVLYLDSDVTGATVTAEFGGSKFTSIALSKPVTVTGGRNATVSLTAAEVDQLKSVKYRIKSVLGGVTSYPGGGELKYSKSGATQYLTVNPGAKLLSGSGAPSNSTGKFGDLYVDTAKLASGSQALYTRGVSSWTVEI